MTKCLLCNDDKKPINEFECSVCSGCCFLQSDCGSCKDQQEEVVQNEKKDREYQKEFEAAKNAIY